MRPPTTSTTGPMLAHLSASPGFHLDGQLALTPPTEPPSPAEAPSSPITARLRGAHAMASEHAAADDIVYDLISIQYHALKGAQVYDKYLADAHDHDDIKAFIEQVRNQDNERARRAHDLLATITPGGLG